ncbi:platelet-activating factor acetylhydrolase precursor [Grosmannia clavigera kw1407]|uniref:Putative phospholipase n=1 Tax=Grosmannia clavigera (strain kw1407 / UAMH 11150) TaxID=655863 RepID=F0XL03_GROCL|nr:platelet-activating factor acetylhydrolase precursor [Grosmannia clavigera kw1407]EFX01745.1 platelet-activating factor acetylhydrolase precursor [Grosmannia clavigera kw1407]
MAAFLSRLNPVPSFSNFTGPYRVGTIDVEIPVTALDSPSPTPDHADGIHTVQFRIFYPIAPDAEGRYISWLPAPQRSHVSAYTQFLGAGPILAEFVSFLPRHLYYTTIPARKNAALLEPTTPSRRWPTMIFSHGLGGSRNAYSHMAGSVASHGVVVVCPEHRDGSSVVSFVRDPAAQDRFFRRSTRTVIPYLHKSHAETDEEWALRDQQLRIRLWELGLVHDALVRLDEARPLVNLNGSTPATSLAQFAGKLAVHSPGDIIWAGHSFGSASVVQLLKTTYYADTDGMASIKSPLFTPRPDSRLRAQISETSPTILLDLWCFPLLSPEQHMLFQLPLPAYADVPDAAGGRAILAVGSETFYKWTPHLHTTARVLSPDPSAAVVSSAAYLRPNGIRLSEPNYFYVRNSAHLNQSDFGLLFPWLTGKIFGATKPERALRLNLRAILQMLRANGRSVARTWAGDLVDGSDVDKLGAATAAGPSDGIDDDKAIFDHGSGIESWAWIDIIGLGTEAPDSGSTLSRTPEHDGVSTETAVADNKGKQAVDKEMEPHLAVASKSGNAVTAP